jgi:transcriptional regulator with XRE-family HTH domain
MILLRRVIGDALRARRQAQHRTLREVSTAANVSLGYLSEIERGQKEASSELLAAVCDALGARLSELLREVSSTVASTERRDAPDSALPERRDAAVRADRHESDKALSGHREATDRALAEHRESDTASASASATASAGAVEEREAAPVALARIASQPQPVRQAAVGAQAGASARPNVATLLAGDVSVTVRRDTPLSTTLRARTIRRDVLSGV